MNNDNKIKIKKKKKIVLIKTILLHCILSNLC